MAEHGEQIDAFLARRIVPLLGRIGDRMAAFGTGFFLRRRGRLYLVTARHVVEAIVQRAGDLGQLAIPGGPAQPACTHLGRYDLLFPKPDGADLDADVCALRLSGAATPPGDWLPVEASEPLAGSLRHPQKALSYLISGYPNERVAACMQRPCEGLFTVYTRALGTPPAEAVAPVHPQLDLFFEYARAGLLLGSLANGRAPALDGVSGSPVWQLLDAVGSEPFAPQRQLRLIGIQTSYRYASFIRAKAWSMVLEMIDGRRGGGGPGY